MTAIDTNVLVYAYGSEGPFRAPALAELRRLAEGEDLWALPWPCIYEYLRVVTHPSVLQVPLAAEVAWERLQSPLASPSLLLLAETQRHPELLAEVLVQSGARGNVVFDAHIWTLCLEHGVSELLSGDRDFARFRGLKLRNPFAAV